MVSILHVLVEQILIDVFYVRVLTTDRAGHIVPPFARRVSDVTIVALNEMATLYVDDRSSSFGARNALL